MLTVAAVVLLAVSGGEAQDVCSQMTSEGCVVLLQTSTHTLSTSAAAGHKEPKSVGSMPIRKQMLTTQQSVGMMQNAKHELTLPRRSAHAQALVSHKRDLGCLRSFYSDEDVNELRTFGDAKRVFSKYCQEMHPQSACDAVAALAFEPFDFKSAEQLAPDQNLCAELNRMAAANEAWLKGKKAAALAQSTAAVNTLAMEGGALAAAQVQAMKVLLERASSLQGTMQEQTFDSSMSQKNCGRDCRSCRVQGGTWNCVSSGCQCKVR
eukprot:gnl/MRDRNA2_/MRDRNA2_106635_c0_seq1.p1 gnl/MRDRNA2_/MRDRNA2_106635_c0~~gnl/MRDRNA2_/MRDRNA2_106635_c0_seq1.p1  ORF type:complete len:265 (+),score=65.56 gnl/MRDRNA2_/MRDRNA2_106635_c0_seq1:94-888(+)